MLPKKSQSHFFFADALRALAVLAVIILHTASDYIDHYGEISNSNWWSADIYNGLVRFCVPMFVVLSGAFLLRPDRIITIKELLLKRLPKLIIPLFAWSIIYILFKTIDYGEPIASINVVEQLKIFYNGPVAYHLWFLYMMIGVYFAWPVINVYIKAATEKNILYFLTLWFIVNSVLGIINIFTGLAPSIEVNIFIGYIGYFLFGYYLFNYTFARATLNKIYLTGITGFLISIITPYICYKIEFTRTEEIIATDFTPDVVMCVSALFLWFKNNSKSDGKNIFGKIITEISALAFGIYLVHVLIIEYIFSEDRNYYATITGWNPAWAIPVKALIVLIISYIIIKLIKLIPFIRKIVG
jgi:surface polysaccharide O-acyltransferase-like enzyme